MQAHNQGFWTACPCHAINVQNCGDYRGLREVYSSRVTTMSELEGLKLLRRIEEGVAGKTGEAFFRQIVHDLSDALHAHAAFTSRLVPQRRAAMLAFWAEGRYRECLEYSLAGTPCEFVYNGEITSYARDVSTVFPADRDWFDELGVKSYLGIPVKGENGEVCGHLAVMDTRERDWREADVDILRLFSLRSAAELERIRYQHNLEAANTALQAANEQLQQEVAQRLQTEQQLAAAKLAAETANQAKSAFISNMSHELRTPLNGILGYAQLLTSKNESLTPSQRKGVKVIENSGKHLLNLVNDLLDLAKIEAGRFELHSEKADLGELLRQVTDVLRLRARNAQLSFAFDTSGELPSRVEVDARALRQILLNLLSNAVKFTQAGGSVALRVHSEPAAAHHVRLSFEIEDSGIGIPEEALREIFQPFHRVVDSTLGVEGTGLGLAITNRLVGMMGGDLQVRSEVGKGSVFNVTMELKAVLVKPATRLRRGEIVGYKGTRRSVLVVDDDAVNRELVEELLTGFGFKVQLASNGRKALQSMRRMAPDVLITDMVMPILDGIQLVRKLRTDPQLRFIPIIALSASASEHNRQDALQAGCDAFLSKPVQHRDFLEELGKQLGLRWLRKQSQRRPVQAPRANSSDTFRLDPEVARELYDLAMQGDVTTLLAHLVATLGTDPTAQSMREEISTFAHSYDMESIRRVLAHHMNVATAV